MDIGAHVSKVEKGKAHYELLDGSTGVEEFDFAMLIPPFAGVGLKAYAKDGSDITSKVFAPNGFMKVDADYTPNLMKSGKQAIGQEHIKTQIIRIFLLLESLLHLHTSSPSL